ncbi:hypothetical protein NDU88_004044 [Pleurodeles waltl]|uniref:Uncharacterized protein n=1 Tax=Pleurodeles waltl TaxID=8319 RepID=A0AAV7NL50_PLEWA|nr:hypothetical protein NDU88_004044 [Pleurodeles waltl]
MAVQVGLTSAACGLALVLWVELRCHGHPLWPGAFSLHHPIQKLPNPGMPDGESSPDALGTPAGRKVQAAVVPWAASPIVSWRAEAPEKAITGPHVQTRRSALLYRHLSEALPS